MHLINKITNYFSPNSCKMQLRKAVAESFEAAANNYSVCAEFIHLVKNNHYDILTKVCENKTDNIKQKKSSPRLKY